VFRKRDCNVYHWVFVDDHFDGVDNLVFCWRSVSLSLKNAPESLTRSLSRCALQHEGLVVLGGTAHCFAS
jgi:hypothetical protein